MNRGDAITLSTLHGHLGAHADGPNHHGRGARYRRPAARRLPGALSGDPRIAAPGSLIGWKDLGADITEKRVLLCTGTYPDPNRFNQDFAAASSWTGFMTSGSG